jgi:MFS family permease
MSYLISITFLGTLVGNVALYFLSRGGFFADLGTWRFAFLMLDLPFTVVALVIAFFGVSSKLQKPQLPSGKEIFLKSYKGILLNKSAAACLIGSLLFSGAIGLLVVNFYQDQFKFSLQNTSLLLMVSLAVFAAGSFVAGQLANKVGAKKLTVVGAVGDGIFIVLLFFAPNLWISLAFNWAHVWFATTAATALLVLAVDQVPKARGTMVSLRNMFASVGNTMSPAIGGAMLVLFSQASADVPGLGFQVAGLVLGAMSLAAAAIILFIVKDPTRALLREEKEKAKT